MSELVKCDQSETCNSDKCIHKTPHHKDDVCNMPCGTSANRATCVMVVSSMGQPPKPTRKRSAPLYKELLDQNKSLEIENHSLKITVDILKNAPLFGVLLWWFRNRKGGGK